ncbi:hypothetical protein K461DRAFT_274318 [Myriangium duriaei CBS 260.36]|uniref:Uncharacterized protein n=1 Tax=Myriangium duriaei CBS 260.36 TaxID=1168546 RepID=A0A9P4JCH4_9PEZI|nr:hypothetical protein K461DRAFT_274318 [Myriangium duriaei CBS 260.36]
MARTDGQIKLPGYGLDLAHNLNAYQWKFGHASQLAPPKGVLVRERRLCQAINLLTDKPEWRRKVFDEDISQKWRREIVSDQDVGFSDRMFDFCLAELQDKAGWHKESGIIRVLDDRFAVVKSDTIVSADLHQSFKAVVPCLLEDIPQALQDWHPGSNDQVLDLVHPSLFPLVYGRSKILPDRTTGISDCLRDAGKGEVLATILETGSGRSTDEHRISHEFQWLPTDFEFTPNGVRALSYINNLHPTHQRELYPLIEKLVDAAIPMWSEVLSFTRIDRNEIQTRFLDREAQYDYVEGTGAEAVRARWVRDGMPGRVREDEAEVSGDSGESADEDVPDAWDIAPWDYPDEFPGDWEQDYPHRTRLLIPPEPREYAEFKKTVDDTVKLYPLEEEFASEGLQVIVKLANIVLTPDSPDYAGGSWHVEGMLNEKICATALYYYDSQNITDSYLAFRTDMDSDELVYGAPQGDYSGLETIFGIKNEEKAVQDIGRVLTREGRMLAFPNVVQHKVAPFSLLDKTRPGHRKIVALFLVAPDRRIISTSNIPPQRKDWWAEGMLQTLLGKVPPETAQQIINDVEHFPISMDDAKKLRLELMEERKKRDSYEEDAREDTAFSFCEH